MTIILLDPTDGPRQVKGEMAPRPTSLDGKVLGLIDNGKRNSRYVIEYAAKKLQEKYAIKDIVIETKISASLPMINEQAEKLARQCDFVLAGVGD